MRQERTVEDVFFVKSQNNHDGKNIKRQNNKFGGFTFNTRNNKTSNTQNFPPCPQSKKKSSLG